MADSGGHWNNLAAAQKLTQSMKIPGVFEEDIKRNNPLDRLQVGQAGHSGLKIEWLREKPSAVSAIEAAVAEITIGTQLSWTEDVDYDEKEASLRTTYIQRKLDHFLPGIYGTYNNYEARVLLESEKGLKRKLGARIIYGDNTYTSALQMDGIHALAAENGNPWATTNSTTLGYDPKNIDMLDAAFSLKALRTQVDAMLHGVDEIWAPYEIIRRLDASYQERGFAGSQYDHSLAFVSMGFNELGKRVLFWDGIPVIRTDYLVAEDDNTGTGASSDARGLYASGDRAYSIFCIKHGNVMNQEPGLSYAYGGPTQAQGDLYKLVRFPELEDYDAGGMRLVNYSTLLLGSSLTLGRIFDILDSPIVV
ncbi:hypothetical protein LCGC14_1234970 [marine sediment metagenome]|uniref:Major capsid protein n=1 Tax=marine sediment metagenome TaxID=412755 RepID=A0A0F9L7C9_9ZZZZ